MKKNKVLSISCFPTDNFKQLTPSFSTKKFSFSPKNQNSQNNTLSVLRPNTQTPKNERTLNNFSRVNLLINPLNHLKHPSFDFNIPYSLSPITNSANQTGKKTKSKFLYKLNKKPNIPYPKLDSRNKPQKIGNNTLIFHNSIIKEAIDKRKMKKLWKNALIGEHEVTMVQIRNPSLNMKCNKKLHFKDKLRNLLVDGHIDNNFSRNIDIMRIKL